MNSEEDNGISINISPGIATASGSIPTLMVRVYYSSYYLWSAKHFKQLATDIENSSNSPPHFDIQHRAYVTSSILSSIAFLECAINELLKDVVDKHESYIENIDDASKDRLAIMWELTEGNNRYVSVLEKYQRVLKYCQKKEFMKGENPYQDADLAIKIRNELMHYKPQSYGGNIQHGFISKLAGKFSNNPLMNGSDNPYFPDKCLGSSCADWAVSSTEAFSNEFFTRLSIIPNYQRVIF
jgi:hypothetical protein